MPSAMTRAGSIPACAGEPCQSCRLDQCEASRGLSPRVRGNRTVRRVCACQDYEVYPRVCGGTPAYVMRHIYLSDLGSIPACAGEPDGLPHPDVQI